MDLFTPNKCRGLCFESQPIILHLIMENISLCLYNVAIIKNDKATAEILIFISLIFSPFIYLFLNHYIYSFLYVGWYSASSKMVFQKKGRPFENLKSILWDAGFCSKGISLFSYCRNFNRLQFNFSTAFLRFGLLEDLQIISGFSCEEWNWHWLSEMSRVMIAEAAEFLPLAVLVKVTKTFFHLLLIIHPNDQEREPPSQAFLRMHTHICFICIWS